MSARRAGRRPGLLVGLLAGVLVAGCGGPAAAPPAPANPVPAAPSGPTLPPRPVELRLDGIDPCRLLTPAQQAKFGLDEPPHYGPDSDVTGGPDCGWLRSSARPYGAPLIRTMPRLGVPDRMGSDQPEQIIDIGGFPALQTTGSFSDPQRHCLVLVDVAPGQMLWNQYAKPDGSLDGLNHEVACAKARELAGYTLANLRAQLKK